MKKVLLPLVVVLVLIGIGAAYYVLFFRNLNGSIVIPYIAHQKPTIDPHLPGYVDIEDKLDEVLFDGLFNVSANPSGVVYEDGLGELIGISSDNVVSIRLKSGANWHSSYPLSVEKKKVVVGTPSAVSAAAADIAFTLKRIESLGSLSPDYILVAQAMDQFGFSGPDDNGQIQFNFRSDRLWTETDIKEVLSFKIIPASSSMNAATYTTGTGPYMLAGEQEDVWYFTKNPAGPATVGQLLLKPYIDNSTFTTEIKNRAINTLLSTPFGAESPILDDSSRYFHKSNIATTFFALFFNMERLSREQRTEMRKLIDNRTLLAWFYKTGTAQQRHIVDYRGGKDNYHELLNFSVFPTTSYYVDEKIVTPSRERVDANVSVLPDTVRIVTCLNFGFREELSELVEIINDPAVLGTRVKATAVQNEDIMAGNYDAVLVPISGYRSNFLFDLYSIFLREPDFSSQKINLVTMRNAKGEMAADPASLSSRRNFFRMDAAAGAQEDRAQVATLLEYIYGFMSTREVGDKQAYAQFIDEIEEELACGAWLFSLPSLAYFTSQFDDQSIQLYGVASQLSTIEKWKERIKTGLAKYL